MGVFLATAAYGYQQLTAASTGSWPTILNTGLIGRWEMTNNESWPGSGSIMYNLSTSSAYSVSSASIVNPFSTDTTNGIILNGSSSRVDFGILSTLNSGSYNLNAAITASNELTAFFVCKLDSTGNAKQTALSTWNDYSADTGNSKYITLLERSDASNNAETNVATTAGFNLSTVSSLFVSDTNKAYGYRIKFVTNGWTYWKGTSNFATKTPSGTGFNTTTLWAQNSPWIFGTRGSGTLNGFYANRYWKGNLYAVYLFNRYLSDSEMQELQAYTNTYVKANS